LVGGRSHKDVQLSVNQADDELLGMDHCLAFHEHEGLYGLFQALNCFYEFLPGIELIDLSFELL